MTDNTDTVDSPVDKEMVSHVDEAGDREGDDCHLSDRNTGGIYMASGNSSCLMSRSTTTGLSGFCLF